MAAIYGHRWTSGFGEDPQGVTGDTWAAGLSGLTGRDLARGLEACVAASDPWPPTLPEFRGMCLSIPAFASVRVQLQLGNPSPFAHLTWGFVDSYRYRNATSELADKMLRDAYEFAREYVMRGGDIPAPPEKAIESKPLASKPASAKVARAALKDIKKTLSHPEE